MQQVLRPSLRPYATAGVAIVGAGLLIVAPATGAVSTVQVGHDIALTSVTGDLLTPWIEQYNTAAINASVLANNFYIAPNVAWQQFMVNMADYRQQLLDDPSNLTAITTEMRDHYKEVFSGLTLTNADADVIDDVKQFTLNGDHGLIWGLLPGFLPADQAETITPILNFLTSPMSAILLGSIGPSISPWIALMNSLTDGDGFNETLANMTGAFFNGATLDLGVLLPAINDAGLLPAGMSVDHLEFAFGGLFTPGNIPAGPWEIYDSAGDDAPVATIPAVGGSIANALGIEINGVPILNQIAFPGYGIGPLGAWQSLSELIGLQLGSNWNEVTSDAKDAPTFPAFPPGTGIEIPTIPLPDADAAGGAEFTDAGLWSALSDAITDFQWSDIF